MSDPTAPPEPATIVSNGTGRVAVAPDLADLRLGLSVARPTVAAARAEAAMLMERILDALDRSGVDRADIRTTLLSVQPRYDYRDGRSPTLTGYELTDVVAVTVRDLGRLAEVVDATLSAGATSLDGLEFRAADPAAAEREARLAAMRQARAWADVLAEAAGVRIDGVVAIVEGGAGQPPGPGPMYARAAEASDVATPLESGTIVVEARVSVTWRAR